MSEEQAKKQEEKTLETAGQPKEEAPTKKKKINRLLTEDINKKIETLEKENLTQSKYYVHLKQRRQEMQARS